YKLSKNLAKKIPFFEKKDINLEQAPFTYEVKKHTLDYLKYKDDFGSLTCWLYQIVLHLDRCDSEEKEAYFKGLRAFADYLQIDDVQFFESIHQLPESINLNSLCKLSDWLKYYEGHDHKEYSYLPAYPWDYQFLSSISKNEFEQLCKLANCLQIEGLEKYLSDFESYIE
ncbi:hypothetical protein, partial [Candidatus Cardinium sp. cBcalN1]